MKILDHQHGDVEVYNRKGNHLGSARPETGEIYKPPVPGRSIDPILSVGVGASLMYGAYRFINTAVSRFTPVIMNITIMTSGPYPYQQDLRL